MPGDDERLRVYGQSRSRSPALNVGKGVGMFSLSDDQLLVIVIISTFILIIGGGILMNKLRREKKEIVKYECVLRERNEQMRVLHNFGVEIYNIFGVELGMVNESSTQDEIVRIVNLIAHQTALACVNQDKDGRGEQVESYPHHSVGIPGWENAAKALKRKWSNARNLALQAAPELKDRLPHFSEFEPLKSYNAEHLLQKKAKQQQSAA